MRRKKSLCLFWLALLLTPMAFAAEVKMVRGNKVLIDVTDMPEATVGAQLYALNPEGKKIGILEVKQVKDTKALADLTKGTVVVGGKVSMRTAAGATTTSGGNATAGDTTSTGVTRTRKKFGLGLLVSYDLNSFSMNIGPSPSTTVPGSLAGNSFSVKGFLDYDTKASWFTLRLTGGLETFSATGTITNTYCNSGTLTSCSVNYSYLAGELSGHINVINKSRFRLWLGLGGALLFQMSGSTNIPNLQTSGSTNDMIMMSLGSEISVGARSFIPIVIENGSFPSSNVKAGAFYVRTGFGYTF